MIGRGAVGQPWIAARTRAPPWLDGRSRRLDPTSGLSIVADHLTAGVRRNGDALGTRLFRKHLAAYVEIGALVAPSPLDVARPDATLCRLETVGEILGRRSMRSVVRRRDEAGGMRDRSSASMP